MKGCLLGLSIGLLIGPLFFALIQSGIQLGMRKSLVFAFGTWVSDFILLLTTYFLMREVVLPKSTNELAPHILILCSIALILAGAFIILMKNTVKETKTVDFKMTDHWHLLLKGLFINTLNPAAFFIWIGLATVIRNLNPQNDQYIPLFFYFGVVGIIIFLDILKIYLGKLISGKIKSGLIDKVKWISGSAFILSGIVLIVNYLRTS